MSTNESPLALIRQQLATSGQDALLVIGVENLRYLSGLKTDHAHVAYLLISQHSSHLITDYRYAEQAERECGESEVIVRDRQQVSLGQAFKALLDKHQLRRLAFDAAYISVAQYHDLEKDLSGIEMSPVCGWIESMRMIKHPQEIQLLGQAASIGDQALAATVPLLKVGTSERDAALELEYQLQKLGSQGMAFDTIFLSGNRSSLPHGMPSDKRLTEGDLITIDFGANVDGYRSDMTRALVVGEPSTRSKAVYETVFEAQQAAVRAISDGVTAEAPYLASKAILDASEFAQFQGEGIGHGLGLYLHEQPFLQSGNHTMLATNMVVTVEPGIYIPDFGGVRIEDDVVVTDSGCRYLTQAPRDLLVVG